MPMAQKAPAARGSRARRQPRRARHVGAVHRPGAARGDQGEGRGIVAALDAEPLDGMQQVLLEQADARPPPRRSTDRPSGLASLVSIARRASVAVERDGAAGQRTGPQAPEHELRIGDGRVLAAQPIGGGPGRAPAPCGPTCSRPASSTQATVPPPAPTVWISTDGVVR